MRSWTNCGFTARLTLIPFFVTGFLLVVVTGSLLAPGSSAQVTSSGPRVGTDDSTRIPPAPRLDPHPRVTRALETLITGSAKRTSAIEVFAPRGTFRVPVLDGRFSVAVPLAPNRVNPISFTSLLLDRAVSFDDPRNEVMNRSAPVSTTVTHDNQSPTLFIDFPIDGSELTGERTDVAGRVGDMLSGFMGLRVLVNGQQAAVDVGIGNNGTFFLPDLRLVPNASTTITATAVDAFGNSTVREVTVTRVEIPDGVPRMEIVGGNDQTLEVDTTLPKPIAVKLIDGGGDPFVNKVVTFRVRRSNGRLRAVGSDIENMTVQQRTDDQGEARALWRLGSDAGCGNNRVEVSSNGVAGSVVFCATATPASASQINIGSGNNQRSEAGGPAAEPLRVWVNDSCNGVSGVPVTFTVVQGRGTVNGSTEVTIPTETTGHTEVQFVLGLQEGNQLVRADFPGNPGLPAVFRVFGVARNEAVPTSLSGLVLDNGNRTIGGADVGLTVNGEIVPPIRTDVHGRFAFSGIRGGIATVHVDGLVADTLNGETIPAGSFPEISFDLTLVPNSENTLPNAVLLPPLDPANAVLFDNTQDVVLTVMGIDGLEMLVTAGSMVRADGSIPSPSNPAILSLNQVHHDDVPMPMPDGAAPPFAWTLQPGGAHFDPPIQIRYPNMTGLAPGAIAYFLSFDHDTSRFEIIASGSVTEDGSSIISDPGSGLTKAGWGCNCPPYAAVGDCETDCAQQLPRRGEGQQCECPEALTIDPITDPEALSFENGSRVVFASSDPNIQANLDVVVQRLNDLQAAVRSIDPMANLTITSGYRPAAYQAHLYNINQAALARNRLSRTNPDVLQICQSEIAEIERECSSHGVCGGQPVNPPGRSLHETGRAADVSLTVGDLTVEQFRMAARGVGFSVFVEPRAYHLTITGNLESRESLDDPPDLDPDIELSDDDEIGHGCCGTGESLWTLSVGNQTISVPFPEIFQLSNISAPDQFGAGGPGTPPDFLSDDFLRIVGVKTVDTITEYVFSEPFRVFQGGTVSIGSFIYRDAPPPFPTQIRIEVDGTVIAVDEEKPVTVIGTLPDGREENVTSSTDLTTYRVSNLSVAEVTQDGVITGVSPGMVLVTAMNEGVVAVQRFVVTETTRTTDVEGFVQLEDGTPVDGVTVMTTFGGMAVSDGTGFFSIQALLVPSEAETITARASAEIGGESFRGASGMVTLMPGGITDLGIIVLRLLEAEFEEEFGDNLFQGDDDFDFVPLDFPFSFYEEEHVGIFVGSNGYLTFDAGDTDFTESIPDHLSPQPRISAYFDDLDPRFATGGVFVNQLTGPNRFVVTWDRVPEFSSGGSNTIQLILFEGGRIQFGYRGLTSIDSIVGLSPGNGPSFEQVDLSFLLAPKSFEAGTAMLEQFGGGNPFDLDFGFVIFEPSGGEGYDVSFVPPQPLGASGDVLGCVCSPAGQPWVHGGSVEVFASLDPSYRKTGRILRDGTYAVSGVPFGGSVRVSVVGHLEIASVVAVPATATSVWIDVEPLVVPRK